LEQGSEDGKRDEQNGGSEDGERGAPAKAGDEALGEDRDDDGADADSDHGEAERESAMAIEPVGDDDSMGYGRGAAGHGYSEDSEEEIELPQAAACPQGGTKKEAVESGEDEDHAAGSQAIDERANEGNQQRAYGIEEGKGERDGGPAGVKVLHERLEEHAEGKDHERRAEEEADGTDEDDEPSVEGSMPLAGRAGHEKLRPRDGEFLTRRWFCVGLVE